jgi:hypothetical protein
MTRVVGVSNSPSFEDASLMQSFEIPEQPADVSFDSRKGRFPDALPKASCV